MNQVTDIVNRAIWKVTSRIPMKPFNLNKSKPIVSFTFDDCPKTAITAGARTLEQNDVAGTFYVCGGLTDKYESEMLCHSKDDLLQLIDEGHEIGSHLFHHKNCRNLSKEEIRKEIDLNDAFFDEIHQDRKLINFAYPFGGVTLTARNIARKSFVTSRGIRPGINRGVVDFSNLLANSLYVSTKSKEDIRTLIGQTVSSKGWTIFYTHDVDNTPSKWGTTPELLDFAVKYALESGCQILTIRNAIGTVGFRQ
ncbi:MAG: polysaccharide deacetylase family protein [Sneathiella sp.]